MGNEVGLAESTDGHGPVAKESETDVILIPTHITDDNLFDLSSTSSADVVDPPELPAPVRPRSATSDSIVTASTHSDAKPRLSIRSTFTSRWRAAASASDALVAQAAVADRERRASDALELRRAAHAASEAAARHASIAAIRASSRASGLASSRSSSLASASLAAAVRVDIAERKMVAAKMARWKKRALALRAAQNEASRAASKRAVAEAESAARARNKAVACSARSARSRRARDKAAREAAALHRAREIKTRVRLARVARDIEGAQQRSAFERTRGKDALAVLSPGSGPAAIAAAIRAADACAASSRIASIRARVAADRPDPCDALPPTADLASAYRRHRERDVRITAALKAPTDPIDL
ncbi:uncharacterized protein AMSG_10704 [Thecamonas trahens ATCC 50062]|uniref:Uncharacterized protein n=1 Tax=Thecamonas trahens ATCC 50062 TaxID=461836 RepID=A0A0L0DS62_THETB|nr:hypothetical protein AMSG_10704 [Thecamonas trahens ATCC 50062]KNC55105.1 hypothetical protein AMSG_10704 [Thecamonas trahens ATCC 50062]|eukprot:XP_013753288.1 hypothetical protein AMSG_10704 [Thecamonas trahens ATCC 50062]